MASTDSSSNFFNLSSKHSFRSIDISDNFVLTISNNVHMFDNTCLGFHI